MLDLPAGRVNCLAPCQADLFEVGLKPSKIASAKPTQKLVARYSGGICHMGRSVARSAGQRPHHGSRGALKRACCGDQSKL